MDRVKRCKREGTVSGHKYKIGQLVNYLSRDATSGVYQVTQLLPVEGEYFKIALRTPTSPRATSQRERTS